MRTIRPTPTWPSLWPSASTSPPTASTPSSAASSPPPPSRRSTRPSPSSPRVWRPGSGHRPPTRSPRLTSWSPRAATCRRSRLWPQPICCASWALRCGSSTWSICSRSRMFARTTRLSATSAGPSCSAAARSPCSSHSTPTPARFAA